MNQSAALHKSQVFQRFQRGNVSIYNHREDAEEPAEDTKPQFHSIFCLRKFFSKNVLGKKNCLLYKGFPKPSRSHQLLRVLRTMNNFLGLQTFIILERSVRRLLHRVWHLSLVFKFNGPIRNWKQKRNIFYFIIWCVSFLKTTAECR